MKTVKFNEEEIELLVALYEDELKEAGSYIDKLTQTLNKLRKQAESAKTGPVRTGKKRGRKPKIQVAEQKPATVGKKRGRKPKVQEATKTVPVKETAKKAVRKRKTRKTKARPVSKPRVQKTPKVELSAAEEIKSV